MARITYARFEPVRFYRELQVRSSFNKSPPADPRTFELLCTVHKWRIRREGGETILFTRLDNAL